MRIALIGATGYVGSHLRDEALDRNHEVTAIVRHIERLPVRAGLIAKEVDVFDTDKLGGVLAGQDAVISAYSFDKAANDPYETMVRGAESIIAATKQAGVKRLLVVGGAGSLEIAPGRQAIDEPDFPPDWKGGALGTREFLYRLREESDLEWTFLSPAAQLEPGERTATFRLDGDTMLFDADGKSRISLPDYAVAMLDELEDPKHTRARFSVAY